MSVLNLDASRLRSLTPAARRTLLLAGAAFVLFVWVLTQWGFRRAIVPDGMRYVPPGHALLMITGAVEAIWQNADLHFGRVIRDETHQSPLSRNVRKLQSSLKAAGVDLQSARDLAEYGVDVRRGVIVASYQRPAECVVVVLPVRENDRIAELLKASLGGSQEPMDPVQGFPVTRVGKFYVARPRTDTTILSDDADMLRLSLGRTSSNLEYAEHSDALYEGIGLLGRTPLSGTSSLFVVSASKVIRNAWGVVRIDELAIEAEVTAELQTVPWKVLTQFFKSPLRRADWASRIPGDAAAVAVLQDSAIADYVRFFGKFSGIGEILREHYGGVLWGLQDVKDLNRVAVVASGYRDGLPELLLGVWGDAKDLDRLIVGLQAKFRVERDAFVLSQAIAASDVVPTRMESLIMEGYLENEPGNVFGRYKVGTHEIVPPVLDPAVFDTDAYVRKSASASMRYLMPPVTANDIRYRPELERIAHLRPDDRDRYRIAVAEVAGARWFATDARDLDRLLDAGGQMPLNKRPEFSAAASTWTRDDRLQVFVNVDRAFRLGLLSPESAIHEGAKKYFWDLRDHPSGSLRIASRMADNRVRLQVRLIPRNVLLQ